MAKLFTRCRENFVCENCGQQIIGDGYTNHCPRCLYSKHVDNNPGDRGNQCLGLMEPVFVEVKSRKYIITHRCLKCNAIKKNKSVSDDSFEAILTVMKRS
ncbi:RNHCP domain-containing protein [Patescibacteria group bacterium]|nr:RNHCP domain-containing protein [Patescibacteria group bacterium]MBU4600543.1 RNHCP domain-containing protein [Patescibacteria group bacterium]MCG2697789.1 RNHCP domain-containing protein [Candidatus Parcubacteria bacterium]